MKSYLFLILIFLIGCTKTIKYGYLPGTSYEFYAPLKKIDLSDKNISFSFFDSRGEYKSLACSNLSPETDSELEGKLGIDYFQHTL